MDVFLATETLIIELLVISLVAIAVRRLRVPYTVALVLVGLALTFGGSVEGESLLNDGTAIVIFNVLLAFALSLNTSREQPAALPDLLVGAVVDFV